MIQAHAIPLRALDLDSLDDVVGAFEWGSLGKAMLGGGVAGAAGGAAAGAIAGPGALIGGVAGGVGGAVSGGVHNAGSQFGWW